LELESNKIVLLKDNHEVQKHRPNFPFCGRQTQAPLVFRRAPHFGKWWSQYWKLRPSMAATFSPIEAHKYINFFARRQRWNGDENKWCEM